MRDGFGGLTGQYQLITSPSLTENLAPSVTVTVAQSGTDAASTGTVPTDVTPTRDEQEPKPMDWMPLALIGLVLAGTVVVGILVISRRSSIPFLRGSDGPESPGGDGS